MIRARRPEPDATLAPPRRRRRRWLAIPILTVVLLAAASAGLWFFAVSRATAVMESELRNEAERGRVWTCPQRDFTGFPTQIAMRCEGPSFAGVAGGQRITASAKALRSAVHFLRPDRAVTTLEAPADVHAEDGHDLKLDWQAFDVTLLGLPFDMDRVAIDVEHPSVTLTPTLAGLDSANAAQLSLVLHKLAPASPDRPDAEMTAHVAAAVVPALDRVLGSAEPLTGDLAAAVTAAEALQRGSLEQRLEAWRAANGRLDIAHLTLVKGGAQVEASGTLSLDGSHRLQGEIVASFAGLDDALKRLGVPPRALALKGLLGLLGGAPDAGAKPSESGSMPADAVRLKLVLADGRVTLGPLRLPVVLRAIY